MEKSKAISPEIRGLFNKIEKQAEEYENAFNELNKFHRASERVRRENEELILKHNALLERNTILCEKLEIVEKYIDLRLHNVLEEIIKHLEVTVIEKVIETTNTTIKNFEKRAEKAIGLIEGSSGIMQLIEDLRVLSQEFTQKATVIDDKMLIIDEKIEDLKLQNEELSQSNKNINSLQQKVEDLMIKTNNKIDNTIKDSQQKLENMFNDALFNLEQRLKTTVIETKNSQTIINQKIRKTDNKIDSFVGIANKLESHLKELRQSSNAVNRKTLDKLKTQIEEIDSKLMLEIEALKLHNSKLNVRIMKLTD